MKKYIKIGLIIFVSTILLGAVWLFSWISPKMLYATLESDFDSGAPKIFELIVGDMTADIDLESIPEILVNNDGEAVLNSEDYENRKDEMMNFFYSEVYGNVSDIPYEVSFELLAEDNDFYEGKAIRRQIKMTITTELGESDALLLAYIPKTVDPVPVFIGLNFKGNTFLEDDDSVLISYGNLFDQEELEDRRGERYSRWPYRTIIDEGYALITVCANDFAPDNENDFDTRLINIFDNGEEFKAVAAWSFGLSRVIDYVESVDMLDNDKIITFGHSRMGKASLWTAAQDERVAMAISNGSGNSGAALSRGAVGENIEFVNKEFPHWFVDEYDKYAGFEDEMPFDQHMLLASIAPRKVYVSSSTNDLWANPEGEYQSLVLASEVYRLYGSEKALDIDSIDEETFFHTEFYGYHIKEDRHRISEIDWNYFISYANEYIK